MNAVAHRLAFPDERVLVVGLGASGIAAAELLQPLCKKVIANDARSEADLAQVAARLRLIGVEVHCGGHDEKLFTSVDRIVISPGVPPLPALDAAERKGIPIWSEIELASRYVAQRGLIAITGTNGKSTVTTLVGMMCERTGQPTFVGGNLGKPFIEAVFTEAGDRGYCVVEISSFQLERVEAFQPKVAALLNITDDHLDRHGSLAAYAAAKGRIFAFQSKEDFAVVPANDPLCLSLAQAGAARVRTFGPAGDARAEGGTIVLDGRALVKTSELRIRGGHNVDNACAAALIASLGGVPDDAIASTLREFGGLPHRMVLVRELGGVAYYDDSKATNVGASIAAIDGLYSSTPRALGRVVLIAGGKDKGGSYAPLAERMREHGRAVVLIGEATPLIEPEMTSAGVACQRAIDLDEAVHKARALAQRGDVVLLAPACSSFDMFKSYAHRGDEFARAVQALPEEAR